MANLRIRTTWYRTPLSLFRVALRRLVGGWSLERKSLLFFGIALVVPIGLAFWFVVQVVAGGLVRQTTLQTVRQASRDYARAAIAWRHVEKRISASQDIVFPSNSALYPILRTHLVDNSDYSTQFLMLDEKVEHGSLENASRPSSEKELQLLQALEQDFRSKLAELQEIRLGVLEAVDDEANTSAAPLDFNSPETLATNPLVREALRGIESVFRDDGPFFIKEDESKTDTPLEGSYVYYHAVHFPESCVVCHRRFKESLAQNIPFRAVKVTTRYTQSPVASTTTLAVMITIAMVTIAATLLVVHWVLRHLVLNPMRHLHGVSDEISRGNRSLRANIDTGDEFSELGDAFNRMLRHMIEGQEALQSVNKELDLRVDQLAQANLNLYEANRLKSDFLANMSHELRTPLNSIIGFSDVLHDISSLNAKQKKFVANIQTSGKLLLEMINDILDLAKVEAGKMQVTPTSFDLEMLIDGQCDILKPLVDEKNVDLQSGFGRDLPQVFQDQTKLQQILTNLLSNAIKFTPDGGMITVRADLVSPALFQITVSDTGVGIPESDFEVIFEKFRQSDAVLQNDGLTRQYAGTGLGLSIVKELCKLLGGEIRLSSQLGTGSTFGVLLPVHFDIGVTSELANQ